MAAPVGLSSAIDQFFQWDSTITNLFTSLCDKTEDTFRRVHVQKRDEAGNIKTYQHKDPVTNETRQIQTLSYVEDIQTGAMYLDEPQYVVAVKCTLIALANILYTAGKTLWYAIRAPIVIGEVAAEAISKAASEFAMGKCLESATELKKGWTKGWELGVESLFEIIKCPIFGLGVELSAIYGIFRPYFGRKFVGKLEHAWLNGISYKESFNRIPARAGETCLEAFSKDIQSSHPYYLAQCFQVRGNVNDARVVVINREPL